MKQQEIGSVCPAFIAVTEQQEVGKEGGRTLVEGLNKLLNHREEAGTEGLWP